MTRFHTEPFVAADYVDICAQLRTANQPLPRYLQPELMGMQLRRDGPAFTLWDGDARLACAGVQIYGQRGHAWLMLSPTGARHPIPLVRAILRYLPKIIEVHRLGRVEAHVLEGHTAGMMFIKALGYTEECALRKWGHDGEDFRMFVQFPGEYDDATGT